MAKAPLFDMPVMGWVLPRFWAIPVHQGSADRAAISAATELLDAGELVGIFPRAHGSDMEAPTLWGKGRAEWPSSRCARTLRSFRSASRARSVPGRRDNVFRAFRA